MAAAVDQAEATPESSGSDVKGGMETEEAEFTSGGANGAYLPKFLSDASISLSM